MPSKGQKGRVPLKARKVGFRRQPFHFLQITLSLERSPFARPPIPRPRPLALRGLRSALCQGRPLDFRPPGGGARQAKSGFLNPTDPRAGIPNYICSFSAHFCRNSHDSQDSQDPRIAGGTFWAEKRGRLWKDSGGVKVQLPRPQGRLQAGPARAPPPPPPSPSYTFRHTLARSFSYVTYRSLKQNIIQPRTPRRARSARRQPFSPLSTFFLLRCGVCQRAFHSVSHRKYIFYRVPESKRVFFDPPKSSGSAGKP